MRRTLTAVASETPRTDAGMQDVARPRAKGEAPPGTAITRLMRRYEDDSRASVQVLDRLKPLRLSPGSLTVTMSGQSTTATFKVVPTVAGRFDLAGIEVGNYDPIVVSKP